MRQEERLQTYEAFSFLKGHSCLFPLEKHVSLLEKQHSLWRNSCSLPHVLNLQMDGMDTFHFSIFFLFLFFFLVVDTFIFAIKSFS